MKSVTLALFLAGILLVPGPAIAEDNGTSQKVETSTPFVVYYFFTEPRCTTCQTIEKLTAEAIHNHFETELQEGQLSWQVIDIGKEPNKHYIKTSSLYTKSVVIARMENGEPVDFMILQDVWALVHKPDKFDEYVEREITGFMKGTHE